MNNEQLLAEIQRLEALIALHGAVALPAAFGTPSEQTSLAVPNNGLATLVMTVPVTAHPIIVTTTFMISDPILGRYIFNTVRSEVNLSTPFITTANEFLVTQPGFVNPPTINAPTIVGSTVQYTVTNPIAGNPIDVTVYSIIRTAPI